MLPFLAKLITSEDIAISKGHQTWIGEPPGTTIVNGRRYWLMNLKVGATKANGGKTYGFDKSCLSSNKSWANRLIPCEQDVAHGVKCGNGVSLLSSWALESNAIRSKECPHTPPKILCTFFDALGESWASAAVSRLEGKSAWFRFEST